MKREQINKILMNIVTVALGIGVITFGYFSFFKKEDTTVDSVKVVADLAFQTTIIGTDIDNTVRSLRDLSRAVALSAVIFDLSSFKSLENFSVPVQAEKEGRDNPFTPTEWKLRIKALEASAKGSVATPVLIETPATVKDKKAQGVSESMDDFFGTFAPGI